MNDALYIAATGLQVQQLNVDTIANNLANLSTPGFKAGQLVFHELMRAGAAPQPQAAAVMGGVSAAAGVRNFDAGALKPSASSFDLAIRGAGLLEVNLADGGRAYVRGGRLTAGPNGLLAVAGGYELSRGIQLPANLGGLRIDSDGKVLARAAGDSDWRELGQLELHGFANPEALKPGPDGLYLASADSGQAYSGKPGEDGFGVLAQSFVEGSNVKMGDEMVNLMLAQRAYQLNAKMIETADELMAMTNGLRRS